jgi:putative ABC transport system permease protein
MDTLVKDIRYAVRSLVKRPGFAFIAVITLALGIGATTAMFTMVNSVLLRPLAFPEPDRIVLFEGINPGQRITQSSMSAPDIVDWQKQSQSFEQMAAYESGGSLLASGDETERVRGTGVNADFFPLFRTNALKGRTIQSDDLQPGRENAIVISYALWQRRFGGASNVINSKVILSGKSATIVGVMPQGFDYPTQTEIWEPLPLDPTTERRDNREFSLVTRLRPGVTLQQAQTEMDTITQRLAQEYVDTNHGWGVRLMELRERLVGGVRSSLLLLMGAVVFVLLIACVNVANLLLARAGYRYKEMALRSALGATRVRIIRQLLTETVLLSVLSGAAGIVVSIWLTRLLIALSQPNSPRLDEIRTDSRVFLFSLGVTILTGIVFGLAPALQASRPDLNEALKETGRQGSQSVRRNRVGSALMVSEIALSFVLLVGAGLLIKSFVHLRDVNPGFNADNVLTMRVTLPPGKYVQGEPRAQIYHQLIERLKAVPGVQSAGAILSLPLGGDTFNVGRALLREGRPATPAEASDAMYLVVTPDYFRTLQIPVINGRPFTDQDTNQTTKVVIVNETLARQPICAGYQLVEFELCHSHRS